MLIQKLFQPIRDDSDVGIRRWRRMLSIYTAVTVASIQKMTDDEIEKKSICGVAIEPALFNGANAILCWNFGTYRCHFPRVLPNRLYAPYFERLWKSGLNHMMRYLLRYLAVILIILLLAKVTTVAAIVASYM